MKYKKHSFCAGFTLIELIVVLAIFGILAAIAVPAMLVFIEHGREVNRMNIARTVYLAAQNQMTELRVTKGLKSTVARDYYEYDLAGGKYIEKPGGELLSVNNVFTSLGDYLPPSELLNGNEKYIHYIKKDAGELSPDNPVIELLGPVVLDKSVLEGAILIEFNIRTGGVLSVFYGDVITGGFHYNDSGADDKNSVFGKRGMGNGGYEFASLRKQGYYGVEDTGVMDETLPAFIKVYDSFGSAHDNANMLCAEILIAQANLDSEFDLFINGTEVESGVSFSSLSNAASDLDGIEGALWDYAFKSGADTALMYRYDGDINIGDDGLYLPAEQRYARIIWVLDYVGGNMTGYGAGNTEHSIGVKYAGIETGGGKSLLDGTSNLRVGIKGDVSLESFTEAHPYFATEHQGAYGRGNYTVMSARHLYNIRYMPGANFSQREDIDLNAGAHPIVNFAPIPDFTGTYTGAYRNADTGEYEGYAIRNLTIDVPQDNVGLFESISGAGSLVGGYSHASVAGLTLENPSVSGANNTGSVCGVLDGFITGIYVGYTDGDEGRAAGAVKKISGGSGVGGIVGENKGLFADCTFISPVGEVHISGTAAGTVGGLVGNNSGAVRRALFLALAPENGAAISPAAGINTSPPGSFDNLYYLMGSAIRPAIIPPDYNTKAVNHPGICTGLGTAEFDFATVAGLGDGWEYDGALNMGNVLEPGYRVYPYPYFKHSQPKIAHYPQWPIADGAGDIEISNIAYYERYQDNTYGLWFIGEGGGSLSDSKVIAEAGYVILLSESLSGTHYFFAGASGGEAWDYSVRLDLSNNTDFALGIGTAAKKHAAWESEAEVWAFALPLDAIVSLSDGSAPLRIMYTISSAGAEPHQMDGFLQPLFAKGLYRAANPTEFAVRTPWQMRNIGVLTGGANHTSGKTFVQERELDFENTGIGVNVSRAPANYSNLTLHAVSGSFNGTYEGGVISNVVINAPTGNPGLFSENNGVIRGLTLMHSTVTGNNASLAGGIAVTNTKDGKIENCKVADITLFANHDVGGIVGQNNGSITGTVIGNGSNISSQNRSGAGIAAINALEGVIDDCKVSYTAVDGLSGIGGVAGRNFGKVSGTNVESGKVSGRNDNIGGVAGENAGTIENCMVVEVDVTEGVNNIGGVAGRNYASVLKTGVDNSTVKSGGGGSSIGGVVGRNEGTVEDVFFVSAADPATAASRPISDSGGGVVGHNSGTVTYALFIAPAPQMTRDITNQTIYPFVRSGVAAQDNTCYFLAGYRYSIDTGRTWTPADYNRLFFTSNDVRRVCSGGGTSMITNFIHLDWLNFISEDHVNFKNWRQPTGRYPYPIIKGMTAPASWPIADSPVRPDQLDTSDWVTALPISDSAQALGFVNGGFDDAFVHNPGVNVPTGGASGGWTDNTWDTVDMDSVNGWWTRPVSSRYNYFNPSGFPSATNTDGYYYFGPVKWKLIELQEPNGKADFMPTDHRGHYRNRDDANVAGSPYRYAELNAQLEGTLYQVCPTTPGAQFYYSFYHATNIDGLSSSGTRANSMSFYLSPIGDDDVAVVRGEEDAAKRDGAKVLIRPCSSPRSWPSPSYSGSLPGISGRILNPSAWNTVVYDSRSGDFVGFDLSYHRGRSYLQPDGTMKTQNIPTSGNVYLYDVWVGDTSTSDTNGGSRGGYGITFWSTSVLTTGNANNSRIPLAGISQAQYNNSSWAWLASARSNVIGYWGVEYGWKHYYGLYTVPQGQTRTEFAYQSNSSSDITRGNYLDGVNFESPAFLSIDKFIKMGSEDVKFVKPGDTMTVELYVRNTGEIAAESIVITDKLTPFTEYIDYVPNSVRLGASPLSDGVSYQGGVLSIALPSGTRLRTGESLTVRFDIRARDRVLSNGITETLLYYFKNQAVVSFHEDNRTNENKYDAYTSKVHNNGSGPEPVQVFIDPIKLSKTVVTAGAPENAPLIDGPFVVTLTVENTLGGENKIETTGLISDLIPSGFVISDTGNLDSADTVYTQNSDGSTRITIRNVNISESQKSASYTYTLRYAGDGYGVSYTSVDADYRYLYSDDESQSLSVLLKFPHPVVGISVKTQCDAFTTEGSSTQVFDITDNDMLANRLADDNYYVVPEVVLTDAAGNPMPKNGEDNYWVDGGGYTAVLVRGTNNLEFTPVISGEYKLYYKVELMATKLGGTPESFDLSSGVTEVTVTVPGAVAHEAAQGASPGDAAGSNELAGSGEQNSEPIGELADESTDSGGGGEASQVSADHSDGMGDGAAEDMESAVAVGLLAPIADYCCRKRTKRKRSNKLPNANNIGEP